MKYIKTRLLLLLSCLLLLCSCGSQTANNNNPQLPDVKLAEISKYAYYQCTVSDKSYEADRDLYFVKAETDDGFLCRFHSSEEYYNYIQIGQEIEVLVCQVDYLNGSKIQCYVGQEELTGVLLEFPNKEKYIKPDVDYVFATLVKEENCDYTITGFKYEEERHFNGKTYSTTYHYYVFAENENDEQVHFDNKELYNNRTIGDVLNMVVHSVDYPLDEMNNVYYIDGVRVKAK